MHNTCTLYANNFEIRHKIHVHVHVYVGLIVTVLTSISLFLTLWTPPETHGIMI